MSIEKQIEEMDLVVLNCYRNKYYTDGNSTEQGIIANAINDILPILVSLKNCEYHKQSEVVRCKDCEHFYQDGNIKLCRHWNCHSTEDNAYCSFAKMKGSTE